MASLAHQDGADRQHILNKTLRYRPILKWMFYQELMLGSCLAISLIFHGFFPAFSKNFTSEQLFSSAILMLATVLLLLHALFIAKPRAFEWIVVSTENLKINRNGQQIEIPFASIKSVSFEIMKEFAGGFSLKLENGKVHRISCFLSESEYILETLSAYNPSLFDRESMTKYQRMMILMNYTWPQKNEAFRNWKKLLLKYMTISLLSCVLIAFSVLAKYGILTVKSAKFFLFWGFFSFVVTLVWDICILNGLELHLRERVRKKILIDPNGDIHDAALEAKLFRIGKKIGLFLGIVSLAILILTFTSSTHLDKIFVGLNR